MRLNRWLAEHRTIIQGELVVGKGMHGRDELSVSTTVDPTLGLWAALASVPAGSFLMGAAVTAPSPKDAAWRVEVEQARAQAPWLDEASLLVARDGTRGGV